MTGTMRSTGVRHCHTPDLVDGAGEGNEVRVQIGYHAFACDMTGGPGYSFANDSGIT